MPYITVESGVLSNTQKEELIKRLTEISSDIMKIPQEFFVTTIKEVPDKNFGIGGKTIDKVKAEYMQIHNKQLQDNLKHGQGKGMENVLITGTTSGIGKAFAEKFASMGNNIILVSQDRQKLEQQQLYLQNQYHVTVNFIA